MNFLAVFVQDEHELLKDKLKIIAGLRMDYAKYADEDSDTQLEISKLFFTNEDYANSKIYLDKVFDKVNDPIKYKLRAYLLYADGDYVGAKTSMDNFISKAEKIVRFLYLLDSEVLYYPKWRFLLLFHILV